MAGEPQTIAVATRRPSYDAMVGLVAEAFLAAGEHERYGPRLAHAGTTCALDFGHRGLTILLDREPIEVLDVAADDAESRIWGSEEAWMPVFVGGNLGIALARGELEWSGPVRRFLRIFPIFRHTYAELARAGRARQLEHLR